MKPILALILILSIVSLAWAEPSSVVASAPMTAAQLAGSVGGGFWGGAICGLSLTALAVGGEAILAAATGGATLPLSVCFGTTVAAEITAICLAL
jgi:hypothetical protein